MIFSFIFFIIPKISAIKINEVELNPLGTDSGNEWLELYSEEEINFENYKIVNNDGVNISLNGSFIGYYLYIFDKQWLDNSDEKIFLYKNDELIDETIIFEDSENDDFTFQLCNGWEFLESTEGEENNCAEEIEEPEEQEEIEEIEEEEEEVEEEINDIQEETENIEVIEEKQNIQPQNIEFETIKLNPQTIKGEDDKENLDENNYPVYGFIIFCIMLGFLFLIKQNKFNKNEFR